MSHPTDGARFARLLRWYPESWRTRYGDDLVAFMEDTYGDGPIPLRSRWGIMGRAVAEHFHERRFGAESHDPAERVRGGALLVLCAWAPFVVGGAIFAKFAEHWNGATPTGARLLPAASYDTVWAAAMLGLIVVATAGAACLPAFVQFFAAGRWPEIRGAVARAAGVTAVTVLAGVGLVVWAHQIGPVQRNGGSWPYALAFVVTGLLVVATTAVWTGVCVRAVRRIDLPASVLRLEGLLALVLTVAMVAIVGGTVTWWAALAARAPWVLSGTVTGSAGSFDPPALLVAGSCMVVGLAMAVRGAGRVAGALRPSSRP